MASGGHFGTMRLQSSNYGLSRHPARRVTGGNMNNVGSYSLAHVGDGVREEGEHLVLLPVDTLAVGVDPPASKANNHTDHTALVRAGNETKVNSMMLNKHGWDANAKIITCVGFLIWKVPVGFQHLRIQL